LVIFWPKRGKAINIAAAIKKSFFMIYG